MTDKKSRQPAREVVKLTDLAPRQEIKGGSQRRVFGSDPIQPPADTSKARRRDLPAKSPGGVKGGGISRNDNVTLVRSARATRRRTTGGMR